MPSTMVGRLDVIAGCMFSGKTEELVRRLTVAEQQGRKVQAFKPRTDIRYAQDAIVTHAGQRFPAIPIQDFRQLEGDVEADFIGVDEAQFFGLDLLEFALCQVPKGVTVVVSGLDLSSQGVPFGPMPLLLSYADGVSKLESVCARCGRPATRSQRLTQSSSLILVGGAECYEPRCVVCFQPTA